MTEDKGAKRRVAKEWLATFANSAREIRGVIGEMEGRRRGDSLARLLLPIFPFLLIGLIVLGAGFFFEEIISLLHDQLHDIGNMTEH